MDKRYAPPPGRHGTMLVETFSGIIGTGGLALTVNATTTFRIPTPISKVWLEKLCVSAGGLAVDADGTILGTINKRDNVAGANVPLTAAFSFESDFLLLANKVYQIPLLATLTDAQRIFQAGDQLYVDIVNNSAAIDTQPTHTAVGAEWCVLY